MDYKSVIEEQIRELQKVQDRVTKQSGREDASCEIARTIANLCERASYMQTKENGSAEANPQKSMSRTDWDKLQQEPIFSEKTDSLNQAQACQARTHSYKGLEASNSGPVEQY